MFSSAFEQEERSFTNQKRLKSLLATFSFAALLLLAFYLIKLTIPNPPFPELSAGGVEINFGFDESGTGDEQAFSDNPGPISETPASGAAASASSANEETLTQEDEETDAVVDKPIDKPKVKPTSTTTTTAKTTNTATLNTNNKTNTTSEPVQKADPDALFPTKGAKGTPNKSTGDGTGGGKGDQGSPDGDPNSKSYLGGGDGNGEGKGKGDLGGGFSLKNRKKVSLPSPTACSGKGKVVIGIKVDRSGKVVETTFKRFESTVFDECNKNNALQAARNARFNPDPNAEEIQEGTITYINEVK
jgi:protein TonB